MASAKEIQSRMKSIRDTMKITNAMYMISSSKLKRAKKFLTDTEPYFYSLQAAIGRILIHQRLNTGILTNVQRFCRRTRKSVIS